VINTTPQSFVLQGKGHTLQRTHATKDTRYKGLTLPFEYEAGRASRTAWTLRRRDHLPLSGIEFCSHLNVKFLQKVSSVQDFRPKFCIHFCSSPHLPHVKKNIISTFSQKKPDLFFLARSHNREKRLLTSSCLSVYPSAWNNSASTGRILMKLNIRGFFKNLSKKFQFHYNLTRITILYSKTDKHVLSYRAHFFLG